MAQYATEAEFLNQSLPTEAFSTLPVGTIDKSLVWASSYANSKIKKRYTLPLTAWGEDLRSAVCDLAGLRLLRIRGFKPGSGASQAVIDAAKEAKDWLEEISTGDAELDGALDSTTEIDEAGTLTASDPAADFTFYVDASGGISGTDPFGSCGCK